MTLLLALLLQAFPPGGQVSPDGACSTELVQAFPPGDGQVFPDRPCSGASPYADAFACYSMDDPATGLGVDDCGSNDFSEVNTPLEFGGALSYGARFVTASTQYATVADNAALSLGSDTPFTIVWWHHYDPALSQNSYIFGKRASFSVQTEYDCYITTVESVVCQISDFTTNGNIQSATTLAASRTFGAYRHDPVNDLLRLRLDTTDATPTAWANGTTDTANGFSIGRPGDWSSFYFSGDVGQWALFKSHLSDANLTTIYNNKKGMTCDEINALGYSNLVACYDLDESGGTYADSIGSSDLTAVNTPVRVAGLVDHPRSGTSLGHPVIATSYLSLASGSSVGGSATTGVWVSAWLSPDPSASGSDYWWNGAFGLTGMQHYYNRSFANPPTCTFKDGVGTQTVSVTGITTKPADGEWVFVNCWWDPATGYAHNEYRDSDETRTGQSASTFTFAPQSSGAVTIGNGFDGSIDNVAVWYRPPETGEIDTLWKSGEGLFLGE